MRPVTVLLALLLLGGGCSDPRLQTAEAPIIGGEVTTDFEPVVAIYFHISLTEGGALCSGTIVNSEWVLTAAHCPPWNYDPDLSTVYVGWDVFDDAVELAFDEVYVHPDYNGLASDVAVLHLTEPAPVGSIPINRDESIDNTLEGELFTFVGFGLTDPDGEIDGQKRVVDIAMTDSTGTIFYYFDEDKMTSHGDSGGPALYDFGEGPRIVGVTSWGDETLGVSTCVDVMAEWIDGHTGGDDEVPESDDDDDDTAGADDDTDEEAHACDAGAPRRGSGPVAAAALTGLFGLHRRRRGLAGRRQLL
jgi:secreted trypsin-like serine protease